MEKNVIQKIKLKQDEFDKRDLLNKLKDLLTTIPRVYSCLLYKDKNGYTFLINVDQNENNDTILLNDVIQDFDNTDIDLTKRTIYFRQPSVEKMIFTYRNYIYSLSLEQQRHWKDLELDDLLQTGNVCIFDLDRKGYYIHKQLLRTAFINKVLMSLRKDKYKPTIVSLDAPLNLGEGDADIEDVLLVDDTIDEHFDNMANEQVRVAMNDERRRLVQLFITPRQYDQLVREYANKATTNSGRKKVNELKNKFKAMGYDEHYWRNNY